MLGVALRPERRGAGLQPAEGAGYSQAELLALVDMDGDGAVSPDDLVAAALAVRRLRDTETDTETETETGARGDRCAVGLPGWVVGCAVSARYAVSAMPDRYAGPRPLIRCSHRCCCVCSCWCQFFTAGAVCHTPES